MLVCGTRYGRLLRPPLLAMPWPSTDRKERLPANWAALRRVVIRRDGGVCRCVGCKACRVIGKFCRRPEANHVDHVVAGDDHRLLNLNLLCAPCHWAKTAHEAAIAPHVSRRRPAEAHPGTRTRKSQEALR